TYPKEREGHSPRTLERRSCRRPRTLPDQSGRHPYLRGHLHARRPPLHHRGNRARQLAPAGAVLSINRISRQGWEENPLRWDLCRRVPYTKARPVAERSQISDFGISNLQYPESESLLEILEIADSTFEIADCLLNEGCCCPLRGGEYIIWKIEFFRRDAATRFRGAQYARRPRHAEGFPCLRHPHRRRIR